MYVFPQWPQVSSGMNTSFAEEVVAINTAENSYCTIGNIDKHATITPDVDAIVDSLVNL